MADFGGITLKWCHWSTRKTQNWLLQFRHLDKLGIHVQNLEYEYFREFYSPFEHGYFHVKPEQNTWVFFKMLIALRGYCPRPVFWLFVNFSQNLQHIGDKKTDSSGYWFCGSKQGKYWFSHIVYSNFTTIISTEIKLIFELLGSDP